MSGVCISNSNILSILAYDNLDSKVWRIRYTSLTVVMKTPSDPLADIN
jgi:hypothetical protein